MNTPTEEEGQEGKDGRRTISRLLGGILLFAVRFVVIAFLCLMMIYATVALVLGTVAEVWPDDQDREPIPAWKLELEQPEHPERGWP